MNKRTEKQIRWDSFLQRLVADYPHEYRKAAARAILRLPGRDPDCERDVQAARTAAKAAVEGLQQRVAVVMAARDVA